MKSPNVICSTLTVDRVEVVTSLVADLRLSPDDALAAIQLRNDGTEWTDESTTAPVQVGTWLLRGVVGDYEVQYDVPSGDLPNGGGDDAINTWLSMSTTRVWTAVETGGPVAQHEVNGTLMIRDAVTLQVLLSQSLILRATVEI